MATRTFMNCCNDKEHAFGINPGDYTLFYLGTFDDNSGDIIYTNPSKIHNGLEVKTTEKPQDLNVEELAAIANKTVVKMQEKNKEE